jgi:hypothetical protein
VRPAIATVDPAETMALARRLDWRFLLDDPGLGRVLVAGRPDATLLAAVAALAEPMATTDLGGADRVVAHDPTPSDLRSAIERVGPGGSIVVELVGRPGPGRTRTLTASSAGAIAERLHSAGFRDVAIYWTWPDQPTCREIVPLDAPGLIRLSLARRRGGRDALLKARIGRLLFRVGLGAAIVPATTVIARRATPDAPLDGAAAGTLIDRFVAASWIRLGLAGFGAGRPGSLLVTPRFPESAHVVGLVVPHGAERPAAVVKLQRLPGPARTLAAEAAALDALAALRPDGLPGVPRLLTAESIAGHAAIVETALAGKPLDPLEIRRDRAGAIDAVSRWVGGLRRPDAPVDHDDRWRRTVEPALAILATSLSDDPADAELVGRAVELTAALRTADLPLAIEHGDLSHPNLLRLPDGPEPRIGAIDWELGEPGGYPLTDFLFFLGYVAGVPTGRGDPTHPDAQARRIEAAFVGPDAWAAAAAARQADAEAIDRALLTPLLVATWSRALARLLGRLDGRSGVPAGALTAAETGRRLRAHRYHPIWQRMVASAAAIDWDAGGG